MEEEIQKEKEQKKENPEEKLQEDFDEETLLKEADEYQRLLGEVAEYKDKNIRLLAEFENARKRMDRDKMEFIKYANEGLIIQFLDILDDLERAVRVAEEKHQDYDSFLKGVEMIMNRIYDVLKKSGVKPMDVKGKLFDPHCHEPLLQEETKEAQEGTILEELQKGYFYHDRVIRTAKVKLAKKPTLEQPIENNNNNNNN
ncbi:MAG TPA: nucleotide exchange factor GrpE [Candidatus Omnitrophota bacterium]|nr:nucleotide exchange factor GrpE [Candidatus Omnitrophota bacterium]HPN88378.1 nucleotide exchange factor GrpE [Candidatus Omnitrophota bacterium]